MITGLTFVEQDPIPVWRQGVGWTSEYAMEGTRAQVDAAVASYPGANGVVEIRYTEIGGDLWRATVSFAGRTREEAQTPTAPDSLVEVQWAFPRNDLQRDIWTHPRVEAQLVRLESRYRSRFRADVEAWIAGTASIEIPTKDGETKDVDLSEETLVAAAVEFGANATEIRQFLKALTEGQQFYIYSRRVLRWTRTGPTEGEWLNSNTNTNRVYTRDRLVREIAPPNWVKLKMPAGYWFKHEPEEELVGTKLTMAQEYEYFGTRFSTFSYGEALT